MVGPGHRPGGLTALAVLNFIFGAGDLLRVLALLPLLGRGGVRRGEPGLESPEAALLLIPLQFIEGVLLILSGAGYLGQKHVLGRVLGNCYAVVGLVVAALFMFLIGQFNIVIILAILYPVLTLVLLNTTFKDDFFSPYKEEALPPAQPEARRPISVYHRAENHLKLVAVYFARHNIRGGTGILFTLAMLFVGLGVAALFITPLEAIHEAIQRERRRQDPDNPVQVDKKLVVNRIVAEFGIGAAKWATGDDDPDQANFLVHDRPALVTAMLIVLLSGMPFLTCLGSFNQLSGDIQYKGLRYLLLRTERFNIFLGRFIGTALFTMAVLAILLGVVFLYLVFKADFYSPASVGLWLLHGYFALALLSLPYIALCSWISAAVNSPFIALVVCLLIAIFPIFFVAMASGIDPSFQYLGYVTPWPLKFKLLHHNALQLAGAALAMVLFTVLFLGLGMRHFQRRDL